MKKERLEEFCKHHGMKAEKRENSRHGDIFIADGFCPDPHFTYPQWVEPGEFGFGAYTTVWFTGKGEDIQYGPMLFFDAFHDSEEGWDQETKKRARVNKALKEAEAFMDSRECVRAGH